MARAVLLSLLILAGFHLRAAAKGQGPCPLSPPAPVQESLLAPAPLLDRPGPT